MKRRMRYILIVTIGIIVNFLLVIGIKNIVIFVGTLIFAMSLGFNPFDNTAVPKNTIPNSFYISNWRNCNSLVYYPNNREKYNFRYVMGHTTINSNWYIITDYNNITLPDRGHPTNHVYEDGTVSYKIRDRYIKIDKTYSNISFWQTINKIPYTDRKVFRKMEAHIKRRMKYGEVLTNDDGRLQREWTTDKKGYTVPVKRDMEYYRIILD